MSVIWKANIAVFSSFSIRALYKDIEKKSLKLKAEIDGIFLYLIIVFGLTEHF